MIKNHVKWSNALHNLGHLSQNITKLNSLNPYELGSHCLHATTYLKSTDTFAIKLIDKNLDEKRDVIDFLVDFATLQLSLRGNKWDPAQIQKFTKELYKKFIPYKEEFLNENLSLIFKTKQEIRDFYENDLSIALILSDFHDEKIKIISCSQDITISIQIDSAFADGDGNLYAKWLIDDPRVKSKWYCIIKIDKSNIDILKVVKVNRIDNKKSIHEKSNLDLNLVKDQIKSAILHTKKLAKNSWFLSGSPEYLFTLQREQF